MAQQTIHAVVGTGNAPAKVIAEGLGEVLADDDVVGLVWTGKPDPAVEVVYDYVLDNQVQFVMYYGDGTNPPKVFRESEHGMAQKSRDPQQAAVKGVQGAGKILFLWNDDENGEDNSLIEWVDAQKAAGTLILELTNGLAPIVMEEEEEEVTAARETEPEEVPEEEEEDDTTFTEEELENMAAASVKRYGARKGIEATTKKGIIAALFGDDGSTTVLDSLDDTEVDLADHPVIQGFNVSNTFIPAVLAAHDAQADVEKVVEALRDLLTKMVSGYYSN